MVHQIKNRHIQAVMNNLKFIILSYLGVKKSGIWTDAEISELVHKQSVTLFGG